MTMVARGFGECDGFQTQKALAAGYANRAVHLAQPVPGVDNSILPGAPSPVGRSGMPVSVKPPGCMPPFLGPAGG